MDQIWREARAFQQWVRTGEIPASTASDISKEEASPRPLKLVPINLDLTGALNTLRQCKVNIVCVAPGLREIRVGLEKFPKTREKDSLPTGTASNHAIRYHEIKTPQIAFPTASILFSHANALRHGYYPCGSSISIANKIATGTVGCLVQKDDVLYGLTNNHVTGLFSHNRVGMPILGPGLMDVSPENIDPFVIGHHTRGIAWTPGTSDNVSIEDNLDLAIFRIKNENSVTSFQGHHYDTPTKIANTADLFKRDLPNIKVKKVGRTTGLTSGWLFGKAGGEFEVRIKDPDFTSSIYFNDMFAITDDSSGKPFALPGDSGSLVVRDNNGTLEAVGIVFAISPRTMITHVMPIEVVLDRLGVTLVGDHNVSPTNGP